MLTISNRFVTFEWTQSQFHMKVKAIYGDLGIFQKEFKFQNYHQQRLTIH
jgi:hypothetical protein